MITIQGRYNTAYVYAETIEETAREQIRDLCDMEVFAPCHIAVMPDVHAGAGCTIGTTMTLKDAVVPNMVGVDIGCGMETVEIAEREIDLPKLDALIHQQIPCGMHIRNRRHPYTQQIGLSQLHCYEELKSIEKEYCALGTLGGGNHFIEVDKDEEGRLYIVIHSGSRHLGKSVAELYQEKSWRQLNGNAREDIERVIAEYRAEGRQQELSAKLKEMKETVKTTLPKERAYCTGQLFEDYIHDMKIVQEFAMLNRKAMMDIILQGMGLTAADQFTTIHNYIDTENRILRKGSVSAQKGEKLLIPINMRDGSLICIGKGNPDYNFSAPHGAGRLMSRSEAFRSLSLEEFREQMQGIYSTTVSQDTLDESPMAYKSMDEILANIAPTAEVIKVIRPIYNFKAEE
ncbi:MAG: RtcB family protein [Erysipelotrichaceae bacterium]|nr:RtcB family protein [Erysipelotrichaceae bacterium]